MKHRKETTSFRIIEIIESEKRAWWRPSLHFIVCTECHIQIRRPLQQSACQSRREIRYGIGGPKTEREIRSTALGQKWNKKFVTAALGKTMKPEIRYGGGGQKMKHEIRYGSPGSKMEHRIKRCEPVKTSRDATF